MRKADTPTTQRATPSHLPSLRSNHLFSRFIPIKPNFSVEFKPLVVGRESRFAAHFTALGDLFKAIGEGTITLTLTGNGGTQSITVDKPEVPGIFRLRMTPKHAGVYSLDFDIKTPAFTDKITIENVEVFPDVKRHLQNKHPKKAVAPTFLPERTGVES
ncbi:MAG: hypothetical protein IPM82_22055 [Saprospiraceae bacterium]|nr:hypothetical protein [Saprospiraceae bacterium]